MSDGISCIRIAHRPPSLGFRVTFGLFSGGQRKCVGDQFALMESVVTLSMLIRRFDFELTVKPEEVGFYTGATIHTRHGLPMRVKKRVFPGSSETDGGEVSKSEPVKAAGSAVAA